MWNAFSARSIPSLMKGRTPGTPHPECGKRRRCGGIRPILNQQNGWAVQESCAKPPLKRFFRAPKPSFLQTIPEIVWMAELGIYPNNPIEERLCYTNIFFHHPGVRG